MAFLDKVIEFPLDNKKTVVIMDNLAIHKLVAVTNKLQEAGISIMYTPVSSSSLNPIGKLFDKFIIQLIF